MSVADKVVLITGAARGLGFEYARALGQAGARVVAGDVADCTTAATPRAMVRSACAWT